MKLSAGKKLTSSNKEYGQFYKYIPDVHKSPVFFQSFIKKGKTKI